MSGRKTIQINPDFLRFNKKTKKEKTKKKKPSFNPNDIKKQLLAKIKKHQKEKEKEIITSPPEICENDFDNSMKYVQKMIEHKNKTVKKRRERKRRKIPIPNDPPYGCLKNGTKPTYSQYKKTLKRKPDFQIQTPIQTAIQTVIQPLLQNPIQQTPIQQTPIQQTPIQQTPIQNPIQQTPIQQTPIQQTPIQTVVQTASNILNPILDRKTKLENLKNNLVKPNKTKVKRNKTIKIYKLGKNKKQRTVGVLVKSGKTRKKVKLEHEVLKKRCISDIKYYLRKHNLIKIGTSAPENVLRNIYEDSNLSGDIYNKNVTTLLHNFMKEV